ncbi:MAG: YkgJ family cysteine cluster protein [Bdellovibrionales bacterium]
MVDLFKIGVDIDQPSTWSKYKDSLCHGCASNCCTMPVEITAPDLVRMELLDPEETTGSLKKAAKRLIREGIIKSFRAATGLFTLEQKSDRSCVFLSTDRRCTIYEKRPDVCRSFPTKVGPRVGYCPSKRFNTHFTKSGAASEWNRKKS